MTADEVKNYKSLTAYRYFIDGWVLETWWKAYDDIFLLTGRVKHSYASSKQPLQPWVGIRKNGTVECGHCTCMAGLAETCSHVAAILYWLETAIRIHDGTSCTSKTNSWLPPSLPKACPEVPYVTLEELEKISQRQSNMDPPTNAWANIANQTPTEGELDKFYVSLGSVPNRKPGLLSLVAPYSSTFVQSKDHLPPALQGLYSPESLELDYSALLVKVRGLCTSETLTDAQV